MDPKFIVAIVILVLIVLIIAYYFYQKEITAEQQAAADAAAAKKAADEAAAKAAADAAANKAAQLAAAEAALKAQQAAAADAANAAAAKAAADAAAKAAAEAAAVKATSDAAAIAAAYQAKLAAANAESIAAATAAKTGGTYTVTNPDGSFSYKAIPIATTTPPVVPSYDPNAFNWFRLPGDYNTTGRLIGEPGVWLYGKFYDPSNTNGSGVTSCENACKADANCWAWSWNRINGYRGNDTIGECYGRDNGKHVISSGATVDYSTLLPPNITSWGGFQSGYRQ